MILLQTFDNDTFTPCYQSHGVMLILQLLLSIQTANFSILTPTFYLSDTSPFFCNKNILKIHEPFLTFTKRPLYLLLFSKSTLYEL
jgi:hypothetical protein